MISFVLHIIWGAGSTGIVSLSNEETGLGELKGLDQGLLETGRPTVAFVGPRARVQIEAHVPYVPNTKLQVKLTVIKQTKIHIFKT